MVNYSRRMVLLWAVVTPLLLPFPLHAQHPDDCLDRAVTQAAINRCAAEREAHAEAAMDSVYTRLLEAVDKGRRRDLLTGAQADWRAHRDGHGSMGSNFVATCRVRLAERRTQALEDDLEALPPPER